MKETPIPERTGAPSVAGGPRRSYLLRVWEEPREAPGQAPSRRLLLRDLETGRERCFEIRDQLADELVRSLAASSMDGPPEAWRTRDE